MFLICHESVAEYYGNTDIIFYAILVTANCEFTVLTRKILAFIPMKNTVTIEIKQRQSNKFKTCSNADKSILSPNKLFTPSFNYATIILH